MNEFYIDDITWNDLNMDDVFRQFDCSSSSVGKEYSKKALRTLLFDEERLRDRALRSEYLKNNEKEAAELGKIFSRLGRVKKFSFYDYIFRLKELGPGRNAVHYILIALLALSACLIGIKPAVGILAFVAMICVNIALYFRQRARIEGYFLCLKYLVSMVNCATSILKKVKLRDAGFEKTKADMRAAVNDLKDLKRGSWLLTNSVSGSLIDVVMDYVRMIFHVDIIRFNQMKKKALGHEEQINALYGCLGELELALSAAEYKKKLPCSCSPYFDDSDPRLYAEGAFHPLIKDAVPNSIDVRKSVLFTGSNASGKSTFLKTLAINQIFSQTIYTCCASSYSTVFCKVISSMALNDNILGKESYFVVEIKSLKRIFSELGQAPVMCFIDEVLRGTNTKERIAASSQILKNLSKENALVFAATHDMELTEILKDDMENLHFSETVENGEVYFDYKVKEGPSESTNAIKLLEVYGFDEEIIREAKKMCLP